MIRCLKQCLSETDSSLNEICRTVVNVANILFGQSWRYLGESNQDEGEYDDEICSDEDDNEIDESDKRQQKDRTTHDLMYVLPSRRTIMRYLEDA